MIAAARGDGKTRERIFERGEQRRPAGHQRLNAVTGAGRLARKIGQCDARELGRTHGGRRVFKHLKRNSAATLRARSLVFLQAGQRSPGRVRSSLLRLFVRGGRRIESASPRAPYLGSPPRRVN